MQHELKHNASLSDVSPLAGAEIWKRQANPQYYILVDDLEMVDRLRTSFSGIRVEFHEQSDVVDNFAAQKHLLSGALLMIFSRSAPSGVVLSQTDLPYLDLRSLAVSHWSESISCALVKCLAERLDLSHYHHTVTLRSLSELRRRIEESPDMGVVRGRARQSAFHLGPNGSNVQLNGSYSSVEQKIPGNCGELSEIDIFITKAIGCGSLLVSVTSIEGGVNLLRTRLSANAISLGWTTLAMNARGLRCSGLLKIEWQGEDEDSEISLACGPIQPNFENALRINGECESSCLAMRGWSPRAASALWRDGSGLSIRSVETLHMKKAESQSTDTMMIKWLAEKDALMVHPHPTQDSFAVINGAVEQGSIGANAEVSSVHPSAVKVAYAMCLKPLGSKLDRGEDGRIRLEEMSQWVVTEGLERKHIEWRFLRKTSNNMDLVLVTRSIDGSTSYAQSTFRSVSVTR